MAAAETGVMAVQEDADHFSGHGVVSPSPYCPVFDDKTTIKEGPYGTLSVRATAFQLREFFRDAWARDIDRESLSPQLSRLRNDKIIDRNSNVWFLVKKNEAPPGDDPDSARSHRTLGSEVGSPTPRRMKSRGPRAIGDVDAEERNPSMPCDWQSHTSRFGEWTMAAVTVPVPSSGVGIAAMTSMPPPSRSGCSPRPVSSMRSRTGSMGSKR